MSYIIHSTATVSYTHLQFAGARLIPLFVAVLHGLHRLVVGHIPNNKGHFLQPGQLAATAAAMACHNLIAVSVLFRAGKRCV